MICLEQLIFYLTINERSTFIDGIHIENEILIHLPMLKTFTFNIITNARIINEVNRTSNEEFQQTFLNNKRYGEVICYVDYYLYGRARSHAYSLPFMKDELLEITNSFPGGLFSNIRRLFLTDPLHPFEHEFFMRISQDFPFLNSLFMINRKPQKYKRLNNHCETSSIIEFPHLTNLSLNFNHIDYLEQFLSDTNTLLPQLAYLDVSYKDLEIVTEDFTRDKTRRNCAKLEHIHFCESIVHSRNFYLYFPSHK